MNFKIMLIKLYKFPILFLIGAILAMLFFGFIIPSLLDGQEIFSRVVIQARNFTPTIVLLFLVLSFLSALHSSFKLWQWEKGKTDVCHNCGGIAEFRPIGKYSPHYRCLACGKNRNAS